MKGNAIARIVIYSIVIILLLAILGVGLGVGMLVFELDGLFDQGEYITGGGSVDASKIQNLEIQWVAGDINIDIATDGSDQITFTESGYASEGQQMVWEQKGTTLILKFRKPAFQIGFVSTPSKDLTVIFPADWFCENLEIVTVSGEVNVTLLNANEIELENVSSTCRFEACKAQEVSLNTVSGNVKYAGKVESLSCETISADCEVLMMVHAAKQLELDSVSGDLIIGIHESIGFSAAMDSVSGNIYSDFQTTSSGGRQVHGDGSCKIDADTVSGDIEIQKYEYRLTDACDHVWDGGTLHGVPGSGQEEMVYICLACGKARSESSDNTKIHSVSYADDFTEQMLLEPLASQYYEGSSVTIKTGILYDADLHLYVNGEFICKQTDVKIDDDWDHWEFYFKMPGEDATIQLKTHGGM